MKIKFLIISSFGIFLIGFFGTSFGAQPDSTVAEIHWKEASFPSREGTKAIVIVTDSEMNKFKNAIDHIWIAVYSDTDSIGFRMPLFETGPDSGVFEGVVTFVVKPPSGRGFLQTVEGDTITAKYVDKDVPATKAYDSQSTFLTENGLEMYATAIVGGSSPPMERVPASNLRLLNVQNETISDNLILEDQQIRLISDLENQQNRNQSFAYLVQIQNSQNQVESLSWITGNLTSLQKITVGVTWIPVHEGLYTATIFVWESINNPTALSPPISMEMFVS